MTPLTSPPPVPAVPPHRPPMRGAGTPSHDRRDAPARRGRLHAAAPWIAALCCAAAGPAGAQFATWASVPNVRALGGDFNGDGAADIALIGGDPAWWSTMPVAFSNRDGSFAVTNAPVGEFAAWAAVPNVKTLVGDFDGDHRSDVALIGGDPSWWHTMPLARSNGDGSFAISNGEVGSFAAWAAAPRVEAMAADFDGDGRADVALAGGDPSWWHTMPLAVSNGNGTFTIRNADVGVFAVRAGAPGTRKVTGDFNGDGKADVAVVGSAASGTLPVAFSLGDGRFDVRDVRYPDFAAWGAAPGAKVLVADFDGDGRSDIALIGGDPSWWFTIPVAYSNGDGTFRIRNRPADFAQGNLSAIAAQGAASVFAGDTNGDGRADITVIGASLEIHTALSRGKTGRFDIVTTTDPDFASRAHETGVRPVPGDYDGNRRIDVALVGNPFWSRVPTALANGGGAWRTTNFPIQAPVIASALPARGWVTTSPWEPYANRCVADPVASLATMRSDPGYVMGYRSGSDPISAWAPTTGQGLTHHQGIQRIQRAGLNYFAVPTSTSSGTPAGIEIVALGSRGATLGLLGGNVQPLQLAPATDGVRVYLSEASARNHASGLQISGEYAIQPFEAENDSVGAGFRIARLGDPLRPVWSGSTPRVRGAVTDAGAAGLVRLASGRFLALVFGYDSSNVETFVSTLPEMPGFADSASAWESKSSVGTPFGASDYQNVQIVTDCQGQLYIVGTHHHWTSSNDWADLWQLDLNDRYEPTFRKLANFHATCSSAATGGTRYCDFAAGAGVYVDDRGELLLYGVEHYNDGLPGTTRMVKVREFD